MIPADVDLEDLGAQLLEDQVAINFSDATLHDELLSALEYAQHPTGMVVLEHTPVVTADLRDIAGQLQRDTSLDTVIVRAPDSGAIVSQVYSRAQIESAQWHFLDNPDYPAATVTLLQDLEADTAAGVSFIAVFLAVVLLAVGSATAWRKSRRA